MTRNIDFSAVGFTSGYIIIAVYLDDTLGTLVDSKSYVAASASNVSAAFTTLSNQPYYVVIYHNSVNAVGGTIRNFFWFDASVTGTVIKNDLVLVADTTTGFSSSGISYTDATLAGWSFSIERRGFGTMIEGTDYSWNTSTNTWALLPTLDNPTPFIQPGEVFILHFIPQVVNTTSPGTTAGGVMFDDCFNVTADVSLDSSYMGKCGLIAGASDHLTVTLPALSSVPDNKIIGFISEGGSHITALIKTAGTDTIKFLNSTPSQVGICQCEFICLFKKNGVWNVGPRDGYFKQVGEIVDSYSNDPSVALNTVFANGQTLSRVTYARLWAYVQKLDSSELVNDSDWSNVALKNKAKYSTGDGSTTFRVPLLYKTVDGSSNILSAGFLEGVDGTTRKAGVFSVPELFNHNHEETIGQLPLPPFGSGTTTRHKGNYDRQQDGHDDLTGPPINADGTDITALQATLGKDNKPAGAGIYKMIRI